MDEAERLCDRVAVVDRGKVIAIGTPRELIASLGGEEVVEVAFDKQPDEAMLAALPSVSHVRKAADQWSLTVKEVHIVLPALLEAARVAGLQLARIATHHATLEDVFVTLTGHQLRD
jgi:ABC-2 type transport system ATP-binding protein